MKKKFPMIEAIVVSLATMLGASECLAQGAGAGVTIESLAQRVMELESRLTQLHLRRERLGEIIEGVNFTVNSDALSPEAKRLIDQLVRNIADVRHAHFFVAGYTDSQGNAAYNYQLGMRRATNVARYLIEHEHIDPSHVTTGSHGSADPFAKNADALGRNLNRHVEILAFRWVIR